MVLDVPEALPDRHGNRFVVVEEETAGADVTVGMVGTNGTIPTVGDTVIVGTAAAELIPRLPISVDPNGTPSEMKSQEKLLNQLRSTFGFDRR